MSDEDSFIQAWGRLERKDEFGAQEVFDRFAQRLIALARQRLTPQLRPKVDPEDVVQSAFLSFFRRQAAGQFDVENWNGLWGLLVLIVVRKCSSKAKYHSAERRDYRQEAAPLASDDVGGFWDAVSAEPTPSHLLSLNETVEQLQTRLDDRDRQIFALALDGHATEEIGARVECSERTARRVLRRIQRWLEELNADDA